MRRNWFIAAIVIGVAAIAIAALAMRLTEDDGSPSTAEWADSVCTDLATWKASIESLADVSSGALTAEALTEKIDAGAEATSTLVSELKALGPPDLEAGDELQQELSSAADQLQSIFNPLRQGAEAAANAGSPAAFLRELASLAPQFQALLDAASQTVDDLRNANVAEESRAELQQAFDDAPACQALRGAG